MEMENQSWDGYVNWRGKPALRGTHGGAAAAGFVLVVEVLENLAYLSNASNLVLYLTKYMYFSPSTAANAVTDFMGTAFILALLGGFLADAFFTSYYIYVVSAVIELMGLVILAIQAHSGNLKPPPCAPSNPGVSCRSVHGGEAALLFTGLYLTALGVGGIKGSLPAHGAEQFDDSTPQGRKRRSTFFNYFVFCLAFGGLIAVTLVVWIEDNKGWQWGFGIAILSIFLSLPIFISGSNFYRNKIPLGSPLTTIFKVLLSSLFNVHMPKSSRNAIASMGSETEFAEQKQGNSYTNEANETPSNGLKFLNKAITNEPISDLLKCSVQELEDVKIVIRILPIFASTIMLNVCLAQLSTFSVQQAATMNTHIGSLQVPPASLPIFPVVFIMILAPLYDHVLIPLMRRIRKNEMGITHLEKIGVGLVLSIIAMAAAALIELKRKKAVSESGLIDSLNPLPISFLWIAFQYLFLGSADLFSLAGLLEFFFTEAPFSMRSLATSLSWTSLAVGYYLSTAIVTIVNRITGSSGHKPWLSGSNLNHCNLDRFYWLLCLLSVLNFLNYIFWSVKYRYSPTSNEK